VSAGVIGSVPAGVEGIGAIVTSGDAAAAGPMRGVAGSAAGDVFDGDCGAVLSGCCRVRKRKINVAELAAHHFGRAYSS
jgi:hypothetical protein